MLCGEPLNVRLTVNLGEMHPEEVLVQLVIGPTYANGNFRERPDLQRLVPRGDSKGVITYMATYVPKKNGPYRYGIRIMPTHKGLANPLETDLVQWG